MNEPKRPTMIPERNDDDEDEEDVFNIFFCQVGEFVVDKNQHTKLKFRVFTLKSKNPKQKDFPLLRQRFSASSSVGRFPARSWRRAEEEYREVIILYAHIHTLFVRVK